MAAGTYDILIEQNATFQMDLYWKKAGAAVDITSYTAKMEIRAHVGDIDPPLETLTTEDGHITLGTDDGHVQVKLTDAETLAITWVSGVYDLFLVSPGGFSTKFVKGNVTVDPAVTTL